LIAEAEPLWTTKQVANYLHVSRSWIARAVKAGRLQAIEMSSGERKHRRFDPTYIRAQFTNGKSE